MDRTESGAVPYLRSAAGCQITEAVTGRQVCPCRFLMSRKDQKNLRTALVMASIALAFFLGLVVKRVWFS
ncbi:MAG: cytochrome oxidase small assembly protein [Burkholderiaceae bacterium]